MTLPSGTVTFLFTDIEGSTQLLRKLGEEYGGLLADQRRILRQAFGSWNGREVDTQGDAFFVSFPRATDAIGAAVDAQRALQTHDWPGGVSVRVRMGIHTGEPQVGEEGYLGMDVHRAARLAHAGHGGQVLLSEPSEALIRGELSEGVALKDLGEYQLKDMLHYEHIYQLVIDDLPGEFSPLAARALARNNLPGQLTTFIGRGPELELVKQSLENERLVTLVGPGGVGKTRLSIQAAIELSAHYTDGIWLVELAPVADPSLVPQSIAQILDVREQAGKPLIDSLINYLKSRNLLLVLDNCEHLIEPCANFAAAALQSCPNIRILATSREIFGVAGESIFSVPSLNVVDPESLPSADDVLEVESVRLFIERAAAVSPGFELTDKNALALAQICKRLDGIPLALELAAARVRVLSPQQIAVRLKDSFSLLSGGDRTALPRQQTLRATIDWSHELLTEPERILFRRLAVFVGGWTLEAAEAICVGDNESRGDQLERYVVLDLLANLVDKSLVLKTERGDNARYHRLETVRQYALEKLLESNEGESLQEQHLAWFVGVAEEAASRVESFDELDTLERLDDEYDNLRAALDWSQKDKERALIGLRLAVALSPYWNVRGHFNEGRHHLSMLLELSGPLAPPDLKAYAMSWEAALAYQQSDYPATRDLHERSLAIYQTLGAEGRSGVADAYIGLGNVATEVGDYDSAPGLFEKGLEILRELQDQAGIADALRNLGWCAMRPGDYGLAEGYLEESLTIFRQIGYEGYRTASTLSGLGEVAVRKGEYSRAESLLQESLSLSRQLGSHWRTAASLGSLGWVALRESEPERTRFYLAESLEIRQTLGDQGGTAWCLEKLAELVGAEGRYEDQVRIYAAAANLRKSINSIIDPADQPEYIQILAVARAALGESAFEVAWRHGQAMSVEQAIALGLEGPA